MVLAGVYEIGKLRPAGTQLCSDLLQCFARIFTARLLEDLVDRGGDDRTMPILSLQRLRAASVPKAVSAK